MPVYTGRIFDSGIEHVRPDLVSRWCEKHSGYWVRMKLDLIGDTKDPKSAEQLGYYWGLLVPEITEQLIADGHTVPVKYFGIEKEIPVNKDITHEILTSLCGRVGIDGEPLRLSQMDTEQARRYIDNVVEFATVNLSMNAERLKAWRIVD